MMRQHDLRLLKAATRCLVEAAGDVTRAADLIGRSPGQVSKWCSGDIDRFPATMPLADVLVLELFVGRAIVTEQLAACQGRALDREAVPAGGGVAEAHADLARAFAEACAACADAIADGRVSIADMHAIIDEAHDVDAAVRGLKGAAARAACDGVVEFAPGRRSGDRK